MILTWFLIGLILLLVLINIIMMEWPSLRALYFLNKINGVTGLPIVGNAHRIWMLKGSEVFDFLEYLQYKYPRLTSFYAAGVPNIIVHEPQDAQVILSSVHHIQKGIEYSFITPWLREGLLTSDGIKWHSRRKLLTPTFHFRILEDSIGIMNRSTSILVSKLMTETLDRDIILEEYISKCALDIIGESAMGINLKAQDEEGVSYVNSVKSASAMIIERILSVWQYKEWIFRLTQRGEDFYTNLKKLHIFTDTVIQNRKKSQKDLDLIVEEDDTGKKVRKAFLDCLIETQRGQKGLLTDLDIREEVDTFMFEGHDTTASAICFALWLLGQHPELQDRVYEELQTVLKGDEPQVTMANTHEMVYLEKVIKETLRLYPSVPYISRRLTQDCILEDGTVLPATANCVILPYHLHRNTTYFPDPEKFDPERFSEENTVGRHPFVYIPFSAGPRNCIGQKFAMLEMKITLAKILQKLKVKAVTRREEFKLLPYLIIRPTKLLKVSFSAR